jgi:hypothetical protein
MLRHFTTVQALLRQEPVLDSSRTVSGPLLRQRDPHDTSKVRHLLAGGDCRSLGNGILWHFGAGVSTRASARMECPRASKILRHEHNRVWSEMVPLWRTTPSGAGTFGYPSYGLSH